MVRGGEGREVDTVRERCGGEGGNVREEERSRTTIIIIL